MDTYVDWIGRIGELKCALAHPINTQDFVDWWTLGIVSFTVNVQGEHLHCGLSKDVSLLRVS